MKDFVRKAIEQKEELEKNKELFNGGIKDRMDQLKELVDETIKHNEEDDYVYHIQGNMHRITNIIEWIQSYFEEYKSYVKAIESLEYCLKEEE